MLRRMNMLVLIALASLPVIAESCEKLGALKIKNTSITSTQLVGAGEFGTFKKLPAFCRVAATLKPTSDSDIKIEVWIPATGWNGNLQSVGNGAWAGTISYPALATAVAAGYAAASTDTGHTGNNPAFITGHPEKLVDFAYRSIHEMTVSAKAIVGPKLSFWNGCSTGGRQALTEAQRFPADYDGIIAGAPANYVTHLQGAQTWAAQVALKDEAGYIPPGKYPLLHNAALQACDALDGVKDGVIEDPTRCDFDLKDLACKGADGPSCLTAPQVEVAKKLYAGPAKIFPGLEAGSELGWAMLTGPQPMSFATEMYQYVVFQNPNWDFRTMDIDRDVAVADKVASGTMNSIDPNLKPFFGHHGKLLMYHGWADPGIAPRNSVNYYTSVVDKMGGRAKADDSIRLFMVPGMGHCRGGDGPDTFDAIGSLAQWVEKGKAPEQIIASRIRNGAADRTRPLCPYPQVAQYKGTGSTDDAANFSCKTP